MPVNYVFTQNPYKQLIISNLHTFLIFISILSEYSQNIIFTPYIFYPFILVESTTPLCCKRRCSPFHSISSVVLKAGSYHERISNAMCCKGDVPFMVIQAWVVLRTDLLRTESQQVLYVLQEATNPSWHGIQASCIKNWIHTKESAMPCVSPRNSSWYLLKLY